MDREELKYFLALELTSGIGSKRVVALRNYFGTADKAFHASLTSLMLVPGFGKSLAEAVLLDRDAALELAEAELGRVPSDVTIITYFDEHYPELLRSTYSPPSRLYVLGDPSLLAEERMIAIIGSRKTSDYGRRAAEEFSGRFAAERVTVVSGFAKGIDTIAHSAAFAAGGKTIAVLGSGVDVIYPATNTTFAREMIESGRGAIISELPLGTKPEARNFPWRNRIVSGMSRATLIVESEVQGGSMITANQALEENRDVFAIPGDITRASSGGPNTLIRESRASLASSADQVLTDLGWLETSAKQRKPAGISRTALTLFENKVVDVMEEAGGPLQIDVLAERTGFDVRDLMVKLFELEMKNIVRQMAGKQYTLV